MLRTQYRCHPVISSVANELFYEGHLFNGVSEEDCKPLLDWLPTLCFYNANGTEQVCVPDLFYLFCFVGCWDLYYKLYPRLFKLFTV